jgi:hypothetical protein
LEKMAEPRLNNRYIIFQFPNKYLWAMIGVWLLSRFSTGTNIFDFQNGFLY